MPVRLASPSSPRRRAGWLVLSAVLSLLALPALLRAAEKREAPPAAGETRQEAAVQRHHLGYGEGIILGIVEGVTEYLPVSSTGHLLIANRLLGLERDEPVLDKSGKPVVLEDGSTVTLRDAADAYAIVIQGGAILAVLFLYWRRILHVILGFLGRDREGLLLGRNLILAFLPAAVLGLLFNKAIEKYLFGLGPIAFALAAGAVLMWLVERWRHRRDEGRAHEGPGLHELTIRQSLFIGLLQSVAMWPGTSRSMMTIVGGYLVGLSPRRSAEFSFLLGLITLTAAAGYTALKHHTELTAALDPGPALLGIAVATVTAAAAVRWMVGFLSRRGLAPFCWWRAAVAVFVVVLMVS